MEDRKTAPALRARPLRSYVPLRCVRTEVRPPAFPHPFPAEISHRKIQIAYGLHLPHGSYPSDRSSSLVPVYSSRFFSFISFAPEQSGL